MRKFLVEITYTDSVLVLVPESIVDPDNFAKSVGCQFLDSVEDACRWDCIATDCPDDYEYDGQSIIADVGGEYKEV